MKFSNFLMLILFCSITLLSACGEDENVGKVEASNNDVTTQIEDLYTYPIGVQNGDISVEYYNVIEETLIKFDYLLSELKNGNFTIAELNESCRNYLVYINGLNYATSNSNEDELDRYFTSYLYNTKHAVEYKIKHINGGSNTDLSVANNYFKDVNNDVLVLFDIMEKYKLISES